MQGAAFAAFAFALIFVGAAAGWAVRDKHLPPYAHVKNAIRTFNVLKSHFRTTIPNFKNFTTIAVGDIARRRIRAVDADGADGRYLLTGGPGQFLDFCPEHGCLAAVFDRAGHFIRGYPYRPAEFRTRRLVDLPHEQIFPEGPADSGLLGVTPLKGGDLIITFYLDQAFPQGGGTARIDRDGHVVWYRRDFSNHWPTVTEKGEILVPTTSVSTTPIDHVYGSDEYADGRTLTIGCPEGYYRDDIEILGQDGQVVERIPVFDAFLASPFLYYLLQATEDTGKRNPCDPLHLNYIHTVGATFGSQFSDVAPDDLMVSFRAVSGIGIISRRTHRMTHFFAGSFMHQHSAQPFGKKILLFDDNGASWTGGPSRVMLYDPITQAEETLFPGPMTPKDTRTFTSYAGNINVSPDGKNALVAITEAGLAYEIELGTGRIKTIFENLHDLGARKDFAHDKAPYAARFAQFGVYYMNDMDKNTQ
jgi:hypothetical protein